MDKTQYHEIELLRASVKGDTRAFELIIRKYQSFVCAITYSATGDVGESEALAQEVFISAWLGIKKLRNLSKFKGWLKSIAKNVIRSWFRNRKQDLISKATTIDNAPDVETDDFEPVKMAIKAEQQLIVQEALKQIPEKYREPLVLFYRHKESVKQVALELEISEDTVKSRLYRGRQYLKEQVAAMIETTISETGPDKAFTIAVIGSITALSLKGSAATAAGLAASAGSGAGKTASIATFISSTTGKIIGTAAAIVIGVSLVLLNIQKENSVNEPNAPENINVVPNNMALEAEEPNNDTIVVSELPTNEDVTVIDSNGVVSIDINDLQTIFTRQSNDYVFQLRGLVSGLITDIETGEPVTDAELFLTVDPMEKSFRTKTDEHGFYFFDNIEIPGRSSLIINSFEYVGYHNGNESTPLVLLLKEGENLVKNIELSKACQIDLIVYDTNGVPLKGAESRLTIPTTKYDYDQSYYKGLTNNEGYLRIGGIAPSNDDYLLTVMHRSQSEHRFADGKILQISENDYAPAGQLIKLNNPDKIEHVEIMLGKGSEINGYIEYANGNPGYDLKVSAIPLWRDLPSTVNPLEVDENGFFKLKNIVPQEYSILVSMNQSYKNDQIYNIEKIFLPLPDNELLNIILPVNPEKPKFSIEGSIIYNGPTKFEAIRLRVFDSNEYRVKDDGTNIYQFPDDDPRKNLKPEEKTYTERGNPFKIRELEAGIYSLEVVGANLYKKIENIQVPGDFVELEVESMPKPTIDLLVLDSKRNQPVKDYRYRVRRVKQLTNNQPQLEDQWFDVNDKKGETKIEVSGPGIYKIQVIADNYASQWSEEVNTVESHDITIKMAPGGAIKGIIINEQGNPVTQAKVISFSKTHGTNDNTQYMFASEEGAVQSIDGQFIIKDLPPGLESIKIIHPDYAYKIIKDIHVQVGKTTDLKEIIMDKGTTIEGYVYDNDGILMSNTVMVFKRKDLPYQSVIDMVEVGSTITDSNGFFSISGVPGENCVISRRDDLGGVGLIYKSVEFHYSDFVSLEFGAHPFLSGKLIVDGKPLANQRIELYSKEPEFLQELYSATETDSDGNFTFIGVIPGKHQIGYNIPRKPFQNVTEVDIQKENEDINIGVIYYETKKE